MLFGAFIGLLLLIGIFSMVTWAPGIGDAWDRHNKLVQAIFLTTFNFAVFINVLWRRRRRGVFWISMGVVFVLHVLGVVLYSTRVHPISVWDWPLLGMMEFYIIFFLVEGLTKLSSHSGKRRHAKIDNPI
jgi:hypothetical protein